VTKKSLLKFERWLNKRDLQWELPLEEILEERKIENTIFYQRLIEMSRQDEPNRFKDVINANFRSEDLSLYSDTCAC